jgi:hypothetical protein
MPSPLQEAGDGMLTQFHGDFPQLASSSLRYASLEGASPAEADPAGELLTPEQLRLARMNIAGATAHLPITVEMAWTVPQLLKRIQLVLPGTASTSGALRALIRNPQLDEEFTKAFAESGFLSCDHAMKRVRWKYDIKEMMAKQSAGSDSEVLKHCGAILWRHRMRQPLDWDTVLGELRMLMSWFPELRTLQLLEQLYARLHALHMKSVFVARCWLAWRADVEAATPGAQRA